MTLCSVSENHLTHQDYQYKLLPGVLHVLEKPGFLNFMINLMLPKKKTKQQHSLNTLLDAPCWYLVGLPSTFRTGKFPADQQPQNHATFRVA